MQDHPSRSVAEAASKDQEFSPRTEGLLDKIGKSTCGLLFICMMIAAYVFSVVIVIHKINESTTLLYEFPYTVSREANQMKARLYELRNTLPTLIAAAPKISHEEINNILKVQAEAQSKSLNVIKSRYRGNEEALTVLQNSLDNLRRARQNLVDENIHNADLESVVEQYNLNVLPHFDMLDSVLNRFSNAADVRGVAIRERIEAISLSAIMVSLLMGVVIIGLIIRMHQLERRKTKEIAYREKLFNLLSANIDEVFCITSGNGKFEYVSSNSERILGLPWETLARDGSKFYGLFEEKVNDWLRGVFRDTSLREPVDMDVSLKGIGKQFKIRIYPVYEKDVLERYIAVLADQTQTLAYQQTLSDALENARNANAAKSSFLSHMSHEIRTPMNAIIGMTTIALSKLDDHARVEDCLGKVAQSSRHLLGLINDVLDMSKIEGGKLSVVQEPFNFRVSLQSIINLIQPQTQERKQNFEVSLIGVDEEELRGDSLRLNQILLNILSNAIKFTPAGGAIHLEIRQLYKKNNNVRLRFTVRDTGVGMSPEFLKRLYRPFEQASSSTASKFGGSGLGMAITKNLVSLLGGTISVQSEEGKGTEFTVELPFGLSGRQKLQDTDKQLEPLNILVVDDDRDTCEHAVLLLDKMGLHTSWVLSGEEAVRLVREARDRGEAYDVCFIDWKMPGMDGAETARRIRSEVGSDMLLIIISAYDWTPIEDEARAAGVDAFVAKPFFASSLYDSLRSVTRRSAAKADTNAEEPQRYDFTGKHILLVEDNEFNREVAQEFLEMTGATVECVENGAEAVKAFEASAPGRYAVILMDVQMPVMNGYEATRAIRASSHAEAKTISIIAMTANAFNEDIVAATEAGMNGHIAKPIDVKELYKLLYAQFNGLK